MKHALASSTIWALITVLAGWLLARYGVDATMVELGSWLVYAGIGGAVIGRARATTSITLRKPDKPTPPPNSRNPTPLLLALLALAVTACASSLEVKRGDDLDVQIESGPPCHVALVVNGIKRREATFEGRTCRPPPGWQPIVPADTTEPETTDPQ